MTMAAEACDALMSFIKMSKLDFFIQETPYSSFITIRKKFRKGFNHKAAAEVSKKNTEDIQGLVEILKHENKTLRDNLEEKEAQVKAATDEVTLLLQKLEKAEKEMFNQCETYAKLKAKSAEEISKLKASLKEKGDAIVAHMKDDSSARKTIKTLEKNINNSENKVQNLKETIESIKSSKSELKNERDKLFNEVKNLRKNSKKTKAFVSSASQTEAEILEVCSNNNPKPQLMNKSSTVASSASQTTSLTISSASQTYPLLEMLSSNMNQLSCQADTLDCIVCNETFNNSHLLKVHAADEHGLVLNQQKLLDCNEKDNFIRFFKSMELEENYIEERKHFYPSHWDQVGVEDRIKFRKLAQIKLAITSKKIEDDLRKNEVKNNRSYKWSFCSNEI